MTARSTGRQKTAAQLEIEALLGAYDAQPLVTELKRVAFESDRWRLEENRVRDLVNQEVGNVLRLTPIDAASCTTLVIPLLTNGRLLLLARYRYAVSRWSIEFPRADFEPSDTTWKEAAAKLLFRDTGLKAETMRLLGALDVDPSLQSTSAVVVLATGCAGPLPRPADFTDLVAGCVAVLPDEFDALVQHGQIVCGPTLAALSLYRAQFQAL